MTAYTYGPMLGLFLLALFVPRDRIHSLTLGVAASMIGVLVVANARQLGLGPEGGWVAFPWLFPFGGFLCVAFAMLPWSRRR
jgi:hypothetical protein